MDKIGICGGGLIGASWALGFSSNKYKVFVYDNSIKVREEFLNTVKSLYEDLSIPVSYTHLTLPTSHCV